MIDINTLHIGSTVSIGGKMQRVSAIDALNGQIGIDAYTIDTKGVKHPFGYKIEDVEPIPITEELLTELGFEKAPFKSYRRDLGESEPFIHFHYITDGRWRMEVSDDTRNHGNIACEYLHQAEAFLYLTTKTELIKE